MAQFSVGVNTERFKGISELQRQEALLKTGALQDAILNSANFSSIATDEKGAIQTSTSVPSACWAMPEYFSPSWTAFQADRGRCFSAIMDGVSV